MNHDEGDNGVKSHDWTNSIISFSSPDKLREPCLPAQEPSTDAMLLKIRIASSIDHRTQVSQLIQKKFSWPWHSATDVHFKEKQNRIIITVDLNTILIGTITLCFDTPLGLDVDETYKAEVDHLRANGRKLVEITNFAAEGAFNNKRAMASLIHIAYIYARRIHGHTDFVVEVKARHSGYYKKMLGFVPCGPEKQCSWTDEPVVLLCLDLDRMGKQIGKLGGSIPPPSGEKNLYPYFFSNQEEIGITNRLMQG